MSKNEDWPNNVCIIIIIILIRLQSPRAAPVVTLCKKCNKRSGGMFSFDFRSQFKNCIFFINIFYYDVMWSAIFLLGLEMWWNKPVSYFMRVRALAQDRFLYCQISLWPDTLLHTVIQKPLAEQTLNSVLSFFFFVWLCLRFMKLLWSIYYNGLERLNALLNAT